jgi:signal transduction histidine kinase
MSTEIYILESNPLVGSSLRKERSAEAGFHFTTFSDLASLNLARQAQEPDAMLVSCPSGDLEALAFVTSLGEGEPVLLIMVDREDEDAEQQAIAAVGPLATVTLPWQGIDLLPKLYAALERRALTRDVEALRLELSQGAQALEASQKRAEQTTGVLQTATARLMEAEQLAAVGRVVTGIAHEISTQLALVGYAEAIKSRVDPSSELYEFADAIALAQRKLATAVDQIRSFAVPELDSAQLEVASLVAVVDEALAILRYDQDVRARNVEREDRAHPLVSLKREQFDQVVINLVSNAVQATKVGGSIWIEIDEDQKTGMAILTVKDSGQGMTKEVLERLGEPFFTTRGDRGSGLGVGICMSIAKAHGGSIMYVSEVGVGTTAKVRLPLFLGGEAGESRV